MTTTTGDTVKADTGLDQLADELVGTLVRPDDAGYDEARALWNGLADRAPAAIVRCGGIADVQAAVRFAAVYDLLVAVRGGGHNVAGTAGVDGGLVIDLSEMNHVDVDPEQRRARAGGGATWADVDAATQVHGLATPGGLVSQTGIGGLTLGGGIGWLRRKHGLACDNLVAATLVTADGAVQVVDEDV
ncbi:MAG: FAD-binding oxidoreductase, partial [Actinomycetota bacterium]